MSPSIQASANDLVQYVRSGLIRAKADARHPWRLPVLITSNEGRVVVLRNVDVEKGSWAFFTDQRTPKVVQLAADQGQATATFYHSKERTQLRLKGVCIPQGIDDRTSVWRTLTTGQMSSYAASLAPGTLIEEGSDGLSGSWSSGDPTDEEKRKAFENFALFEFQIQEVELLLLHREGHRRCSWKGLQGDGFRWLVP